VDRLILLFSPPFPPVSPQTGKIVSPRFFWRTPSLSGSVPEDLPFFFCLRVPHPVFIRRLWPFSLQILSDDKTFFLLAFARFLFFPCRDSRWLQSRRCRLSTPPLKFIALNRCVFFSLPSCNPQADTRSLNLLWLLYTWSPQLVCLILLHLFILRSPPWADTFPVPLEATRAGQLRLSDLFFCVRAIPVQWNFQVLSVLLFIAFLRLALH